MRDKVDVSEALLVPLLLLLLRDGGCYDHRLEERPGELDFDGMRSGKMYQALWQMEKEGMVLCDRERGGFRLPQRWFELIEAGEAHLGSWADSLAEYREEVDLFFFLHYDERSTRGSHG